MIIIIINNNNKHSRPDMSSLKPPNMSKKSLTQIANIRGIFFKEMRINSLTLSHTLLILD